LRDGGIAGFAITPRAMEIGGDLAPDLGAQAGPAGGCIRHDVQRLAQGPVRDVNFVLGGLRTGQQAQRLIWRLQG